MKDRVIIDVREPEEYASGHANAAINVPLGQVQGSPKQLANIPKDTELILYCRSGNRSAVAKSILAQQGFTKIINSINKVQVEAYLKGGL